MLTFMTLYVNFLKDISYFYGETPLQVAVMVSDYELLDELFKHGADVNFKNKIGRYPIEYAMSEEMIKYLRDRGAKHADASSCCLLL